ncbi:TNF receptor-associated protein 1, mitochondrial, partial [Bonamia ostreae]
SKKKEFELSEDQSEDLCEWLQNTLKSKVKTVKITRRLDKAPAIVTGHESASVQVMMNLASGGADNHRTPQTLNINPAHPVVRGLFYTMKEEEPLAKKVAEQMLDNAMIAAGLIKDPREMLARLGEIMTAAMDVEGIEMELKEKKANKKK